MANQASCSGLQYMRTPTTDRTQLLWDCVAVGAAHSKKIYMSNYIKWSVQLEVSGYKALYLVGGGGQAKMQFIILVSQK